MMRVVTDGSVGQTAEPTAVVRLQQDLCDDSKPCGAGFGKMVQNKGVPRRMVVAQTPRCSPKLSSERWFCDRLGAVEKLSRAAHPRGSSRAARGPVAPVLRAAGPHPRVLGVAGRWIRHSRLPQWPCLCSQERRTRADTRVSAPAIAVQTVMALDVSRRADADAAKHPLSNLCPVAQA